MIRSENNFKILLQNVICKIFVTQQVDVWLQQVANIIYLWSMNSNGFSFSRHIKYFMSAISYQINDLMCSVCRQNQLQQLSNTKHGLLSLTLTAKSSIKSTSQHLSHSHISSFLHFSCPRTKNQCIWYMDEFVALEFLCKNLYLSFRQLSMTRKEQRKPTPQNMPGFEARVLITGISVSRSYFTKFESVKGADGARFDWFFILNSLALFNCDY